MGKDELTKEGTRERNTLPLPQEPVPPTSNPVGFGDMDVAGRLDIPMGLFCGTVRRTRAAMAGLAAGAVLALHTDDP